MGLRIRLQLPNYCQRGGKGPRLPCPMYIECSFKIAEIEVGVGVICKRGVDLGGMLLSVAEGY